MTTSRIPYPTVPRCTGRAEQDRYVCEIKDSCQRHQAWIACPPHLAAIVTTATQLEPCPYFEPTKER